MRCPSCLRKLKERCVSCSRPLDQAWTICPYCETEVPGVVSSRRTPPPPRPQSRRATETGESVGALRQKALLDDSLLDDEQEGLVQRGAGEDDEGVGAAPLAAPSRRRAPGADRPPGGGPRRSSEGTFQPNRGTMDRTLILVKPDAFARGLTGEIIARFERKGLKIVALRHMTVSQRAGRAPLRRARRAPVLRRARRLHHLGADRRDGARGARTRSRRRGR